MGSRVDALNEKITAAQQEQTKLTDDLQKVKTGLGRALAEGRDKEADKLQQQRDSLTRAHERAEIRLEALRGEMPAAERLDAADRLNAILGEACALAERAAADRARYEAALSVLAASIDNAYQPALTMRDLRREAEYWAEAFNLPLPTLPDAPLPQPSGLKVLYVKCAGLYELLFQVYQGVWADKLSELQRTRKQAATRERNANNPNRSATSFLS